MLESTQTPLGSWWSARFRWEYIGESTVQLPPIHSPSIPPSPPSLSHGSHGTVYGVHSQSLFFIKLMVPHSQRAVEGLPLVIMSLRGVAACNDELECYSLLVRMLRNVFRVQAVLLSAPQLLISTDQLWAECLKSGWISTDQHQDCWPALISSDQHWAVLSSTQ